MLSSDRTNSIFTDFAFGASHQASSDRVVFARKRKFNCHDSSQAVSTELK